MSDFDGGTDLGHAGHIDAHDEHFGLDQGHQAFGNEQDHFLNAQQFGQAHHFEHDVHYANGHAVEYDSPAGAHYEEQNYTNYDSHVAESDASYGSTYAEGDHQAAAGELDYLREQFDGRELSAASN
jgi:hypothetical protein